MRHVHPNAVALDDPVFLRVACAMIVCGGPWVVWANRLLSGSWGLPIVRAELVAADWAAAGVLYAVGWAASGFRRPLVRGLPQVVVLAVALLCLYAAPGAAVILGHRIQFLGTMQLGWPSMAAFVAALNTLCLRDRSAEASANSSR